MGRRQRDCTCRSRLLVLSGNMKTVCWFAFHNRQRSDARCPCCTVNALVPGSSIRRGAPTVRDAVSWCLDSKWAHLAVSRIISKPAHTLKLFPLCVQGRMDGYCPFRTTRYLGSFRGGSFTIIPNADIMTQNGLARPRWK